MKPPESRICDARLSEEVYAPINPSEEEVACAEYGIGSGDVRVARIEPDRLLDVRNARFQVAEEIQRLAKPKKCARVIAVERDSRLELHSRFVQSVLNPAQHSEGVVGARAICIAFEGFKEQFLGEQFIFTARRAPSLSHFPDQNRGGADPRIY